MRLFPTRPSADRLSAWLADLEGVPFGYDEVGATAGPPPAGYTIDRFRIPIGTDWDVARDAVLRWVMFDQGWCGVHADGPPEVGRMAFVISRQLGWWSIHPARVIYMVDEADRFGFAYGTLAGHAVRGEERFLVHRTDAGVDFEVYKFSRPDSWITKLGLPLTRSLQGRFDRGAGAAMQAAQPPARGFE